MDSAGYKIVLSLSHHSISFEYWQRDADTTLRPLPPGNWPEKLAFYASPSGIKIGEEAARAAHAGITNAFDNYFERSVTDETYTIAGQSRPIRNILLDASEAIFSEFFRKVLINRLGQLNDNRSSMPLTIVCEADILPNERSFLKGLFSDSGYANVHVLNYDRIAGKFIKENLARNFDCRYVAVAWTEGKDLTLTLYDVAQEIPLDSLTLPDLGIDPRKEYVKNIIWERVLSQNPWLSREQEDSMIDKVATDFLNSSVPLVTGKIILSDGMGYAYSLNRTEIDFIPRTEGLKMKEEMHRFLAANGINDRSSSVLLLRGGAAGNPYFENNLSSGFMRTIKSDSKLRAAAMQQIIDLPITVADAPKSQPTPDTPPIQTPGPTPPPPPSPAPQPTPQPAPSAPLSNPAALKAMKKQWREVRAAAKGKERAGNIREAVSILSDFARELSASGISGELMDEVTSLAKEFSSSGSAPAPAPASPRVNREPRREPERRQPPRPTLSEGDALIEKGRLKEARDWFRANGNTAKARILSDIIRAQKGVEIRKTMIDDCRKNKDRKQIDRIIKELEDYINDCAKANVPADDFISLVAEYKKIK